MTTGHEDCCILQEEIESVFLNQEKCSMPYTSFTYKYSTFCISIVIQPILKWPSNTKPNLPSSNVLNNQCIEAKSNQVKILVSLKCTLNEWTHSNIPFQVLHLFSPGFHFIEQHSPMVGHTQDLKSRINY